ncbi:FAD-binding oxidoreductase [Qingshengfaniella alkalisoli]|uniref:FAD-binding oxidoreductase n=1 Tax=Qingshengfaniella alkalisoli TaxID=2599296 RepID=A0A5B8IZT7_9RHOB|nr:FAD-binding oxidoreductase [Qingshengfaniella alkalisoli]QDY71582.1 FAD-binding oxidoreductase [Qingshengfaniella alkalisoli]
MTRSATLVREDMQKILREQLDGMPIWTDAKDMERYVSDWHKDVVSGAVAVLRPGSTEEVAAAVKLCRDLDLDIIPQGGNTGLVLGAVPDDPKRQVVISLERMNKIRHIDPENFSAIVDAGCVLSEMKDQLAEREMFFPLALGAQGSCQIGGNVSTNAGGVNVLRYGMTRESVLGLEVVLPDGTIWNGLNSLRKDNRGIDLKQMFIGAEGTLGIVTGVALKLSPLPTQVETALVALGSLNDVIQLYRRARVDCCDLMSAFELLPPSAFSLAQAAIPDLPIPVSDEFPAYALIELSGSGLVDVADLLARFLERAMEDELVLDGTVAASRAQAASIWAIREGMNEGQALHGPHMRTDFSVPLAQMAAFITEAEAAITSALPDCVCVSYGHVGDGNVHLNVLPPKGLSRDECDMRIDQSKKIANEVLYNFKGSISAEHGIGRLKQADFEAHLPDANLELISRIKHALDPELRMNPGCQLSRQATP